MIAEYFSAYFNIEIFMEKFDFFFAGQTLTPSLWAGTNNGSVYIFTMNIPGGAKRKNEKVYAQLGNKKDHLEQIFTYGRAYDQYLCNNLLFLGKEIQLKHRAPVVSIAIIDGANKSLPEPLEVEEGLCKPADSSPHHVIIGSEEQFKVGFGKYTSP